MPNGGRGSIWPPSSPGGSLRLSEGIDNHMTMLVPDTPSAFYLAPFGLLWSEVKASDTAGADFSGTVVAPRIWSRTRRFTSTSRYTA